MTLIPLSVKLIYTAFVAVLVPYYWVTYSPWNFFYFCDVALLLTLVALWTENAFLVSMQAVAILVPQALWVIDLVGRAVFGVHLTGMTAYMFDPAIPVFVRGLSSFHGWLPFLLVWMVMKLGYDRSAFRAQVVLGVCLLLFCFLAAPAPPAPAAHPAYAVNINYVWGMSDAHPQTAMPPVAWLSLLMAIVVFAGYVPAHVVLARLRPAQAVATSRYSWNRA